MFGKRFNLFTVAGFKIGIDISWFFIAILLSWSLAAGYFPLLYPGLSKGTYWMMGVSGMLGLFICIVLHELGHAFVARKYGLPVTYITLFIFGGVAELKKEPTSPKVEFWMAIAGPIVSFLLAFIFYLLTKLGAHLSWSLPIRGITTYLAWINFVLAIFNLFPAFPLDGGRILRAILWGWKKNLNVATKISALIGAGFGFALIILGIFAIFAKNFLAGLWFVILGWFLYRAASSIQTRTFITKELEGEKVSKFMTKNPITVSPETTVKDFVEQYIYTSHHHLYPVTAEKKLLGYVSLQEVKSLPHADWEKTSVKKIMVQGSHVHTAAPETSALEALNLFQTIEPPILFIIDKGNLSGILTAKDLFKLISLKLELESNQ